MNPSPYIIPGIKISSLSLKQKEKLHRKKNIRPDMQLIMNEVCKYFDVKEVSLRGLGRQGTIIWPRHVFCYLAYELTGNYLKEIGDSINRDHSTVINSRRTVKNLIDTDKRKARDVRELTGIISNLL